MFRVYPPNNGFTRKLSTHTKTWWVFHINNAGFSYCPYWYINNPPLIFLLSILILSYFSNNRGFDMFFHFKNLSYWRMMCVWTPSLGFLDSRALVNFYDVPHGGIANGFNIVTTHIYIYYLLSINIQCYIYIYPYFHGYIYIAH